MSGPLEGLTVVEFAGIGPGPFCGMLLADLGADVVRVERQAATRDRGRRTRCSTAAAAHRARPEDAGGVETVLDLVAGADALIEGFRPGVMERLGLGPADA